MSVTYRNLPEDIDPVAHLFGDEKITVPESRFTPEVTIRFYERCLQRIKVKSLYNKSDEVHCGLESLPGLLRFEPKSQSGYRSWLRREADTLLMASALPKKTPYQLQYLFLFGLDFPDWKDIPMVPAESVYHGRYIKVMGEVETVALLYGKNEQLYFITARWKPAKGYFKDGREPRYSTDSYIFNLSKLEVEVVDWQDPRILERVAAGEWSDVMGFKINLHLVLESSANVLEGRARVLRKTADLFDLDGMSIYTGR